MRDGSVNLVKASGVKCLIPPVLGNVFYSWRSVFIPNQIQTGTAPKYSDYCPLKFGKATVLARLQIKISHTNKSFICF